MSAALPPLPYTEYGLCFFDEGGAHPCDEAGFTADKMQAYAQQARADLEAENKRLREALCNLYNAIDSGVDLTSEVMLAARSALKEQP